MFVLSLFYSNNCRRVAAGVQPGDPGGGGAQAARVPRLQRQTVPRAAAARPAQDSAQEAAAPTHLRPGRGVAEDRVQEEQVPRPGTAKLRDTEENICEGS